MSVLNTFRDACPSNLLKNLTDTRRSSARKKNTQTIFGRTITGLALQFKLYSRLGHAVAQTVRRWLPTAAARVRVRAGMWGLWWTKQYWEVFSEYFDSTNFSITIITRSWHNRPVGGRSVEWTQLDSTPHYTNKKNSFRF
jgi:hypothetical protein